MAVAWLAALALCVALCAGSSDAASASSVRRLAEWLRDPLTREPARGRSAARGGVRAARPRVYNYDTRWFTQTLDHFNWNSSATWQQRYLINSQWWDASSGPIFFYTGNEGPIEVFADNSGFVWEAAADFRALVVFAEHRYYGESMPFGNLSLTSPYYAQWLTSEQALADFAVLVRSLRESLGAPRAPLIAFGGSYGGMLSAWFRIKYPHVVQGAIAASAPIWLFPGLTDPEAFMEITTRTYAGAGSSCAESIQKSWGIMTQMAASPAGAAQISQLFALCTPLSGVADLQNYLFPWVADALVSMAMGDYPYPTTFLGPLPANPVNASCAFFQDSSSGEQIVASLAQLMGLYGNYSGEAGPCNDIGNGDGSAQLQSQVQQIDAWGYQTCCEMVMPQSQDNVHDMFYPMPWSLQDYIRSCQQQFGTTPRPDWVPTYYGGHDIHDSTNIVFSNGNLDPWSSGGVLQNITDALPAVYILGGAHHFDLRASNAADPPSVVAARQFHRAMISQWLAESQVSH